MPDLIRGLLATNPADREKAFYALYGNIWHQGKIYEATAYAVPFLIELLTASNVHDKDQILCLLAQLHGRLMYTDVDGRFTVVEVRAQKREFATTDRSAPSHQKATRSAIRRGLDIYIRMLGESDARLRLCAVRLLACFEEEASSILPKIAEAIRRESVPDVKASMALSMGILARSGSEYLQVLRDIALFDKDSAAKLGASLALLRLMPKKMPPEAIDTIHKAIGNLNQISQLHEGLQVWDIAETLDSLDRDSPLFGVIQQ